MKESCCTCDPAHIYKVASDNSNSSIVKGRGSSGKLMLYSGSPPFTQGGPFSAQVKAASAEGRGQNPEPDCRRQFAEM